jgi:excisionase family DNA binding protein
MSVTSKTELTEQVICSESQRETDNQPRSIWMTATEAARYLKVQPRTLLLWARQGKLKGFALSGTKRRVWRFRQTDLDAILLSPSVLSNERRVVQ